MKNRAEYLDISELVTQAKEVHGITNPNNKMTDDEIRKVVRSIGEHAPDTIWVDGKPVFGRQGIGIMLTITVTEFPDFYSRYGLSQFN
jgi:hypothetical protein